jgi:hypothetical protein
MDQLVDTSSFPTGENLDYESEEEVEQLEVLRAEAWRYLHTYRWDPPIADLVLAFGIGTILALFLARREPGTRPEDAERWVVVGNLPSMHFETDDAPTPAVALRLYCAIAQDWADNVLDGRDLSESYPIPVSPTRQHAEILLSRIDFIRTKLIPMA